MTILGVYRGDSEMLARLSLRFKITLLVVTLVAVAGTGFSHTAFSGINDIVLRSVGLGTKTAVQTIVQTVDVAWLTTVNPADMSDDPQYKRLRGRLQRLTIDGVFTFVQVIRINPERQTITHIVDLYQDPKGEYAPGTEESISAEPVYGMVEAGFEPIRLEQLPGYYMASWAPILDDQGKLVGQIIATVDMSDIVRVMQTIGLGFLLAIFALILFAGSAAFMFGSKFEKAAVTDGLMGIYNHKYFKQRLEEEAARSRRYGQQTSLVLFDIDFFKRVNDTYGHATGDLVLKLIAKWVTEMSRNTDVVCRYGGEEIACILPHTGIAGAQEFAERLRLKISQQVVRDPEEDAEFRVTVSVGVTQWEKGMEFMDMIKAADAALYHSKHTGRNRVTVYHEELLPAPGNMASKPERTKEKR